MMKTQTFNINQQVVIGIFLEIYYDLFGNFWKVKKFLQVP